MRTPKRIQRKRTKGWKMPEDAVYVGRPTKWGNPFVTWRDGHQGYDRHFVAPEIAVDMFRRMVTEEMMWSSIPPHKWPKGCIPGPTQWTMLVDVERELRGKDLACWCPIGQPCHADVLLELANSASPETQDTP